MITKYWMHTLGKRIRLLINMTRAKEIKESEKMKKLYYLYWKNATN